MKLYTVINPKHGFQNGFHEDSLWFTTDLEVAFADDTPTRLAVLVGPTQDPRMK